MDLKKELSKPRSNLQVQKIVAYMGSDEYSFDQLMNIFFGTEFRATQYAAHILSHCVDNVESLIKPYIPRLIDNLDHYPAVAVRRNTVRLLQNQIIEVEHQGKLYNHCFQYLTSSQEPIAVKAFSMTILANMASSYPELKNELIPIIEDLIKFGSPGIVSRGKRTLQFLKKLP